MEYCEHLSCFNIKPCSKHSKEARVPRVVVLGSTGHQGGSVCSVLAKTQKYELVALTRDCKSESALALKRQFPDVKLVEADNDDKASLVRAFQGAWAVFGFTTSDYTSDTHEYNQGKNIADAAEEAKVQVVLWSTVPHAFKVSGGEIKVPGFDTKAEIAYYMGSKPFKTISLIAVSFFENVLTILAPRADSLDPKKFVISNPCKPETAIPYFSAAEDTGKFAEFALDNIDKYGGKAIVMAGDYLSNNELAARLGKFFNRDVEFKQASEDGFKSHIPSEKVANALMAMFKYYDSFGYGCGGVEVVDRERGSKLEEWLGRHKDEPAFAALK